MQKPAPVCRVATLHTAAKNASDDEMSRLIEAANRHTPRSIEGAHELLVRVDILLEQVAACPRDAVAFLPELQSLLARLLDYTSAETGLPV